VCIHQGRIVAKGTKNQLIDQFGGATESFEDMFLSWLEVKGQ
jgi:hypothetical protein